MPLSHDLFFDITTKDISNYMFYLSLCVSTFEKEGPYFLSIVLK